MTPLTDSGRYALLGIAVCTAAQKNRDLQLDTIMA